MKIRILTPLPRSLQMKGALGIIALSLLTFTLCAQEPRSKTLSKQDVTQLVSAGLSASVIVQQIRKDGIAFDMDAATTLELKRAGVSDEILAALLDASSKPPNAADNSVHALYEAGKYADIADHMKAVLAKNPADAKSHAVLILALLKLGDRLTAEAEFAQLKSAVGAESPYVKRIDELFDSLAAQEKVKEQFVAAVRSYDARRAFEAVDRLKAADLQKRILRAYLYTYEADFKSARRMITEAQVTSFKQKQHISPPIIENITKSENAYTQLLETAERYIHSPLAASYCNNYGDDMQRYFGEFSQISLKEYASTISALAQTAPLSDYVMDLVFHLAVISGQYGDLENVGDRLLASKGKLRIPFYSDRAFFWVVIDKVGRRIYTEPDSQKFLARYAPLKPGDFNDQNSPEVPFDLKFEEISSIEQNKGHNNYYAWLGKHAYALKFGPQGVAPHYAL